MIWSRGKYGVVLVIDYKSRRDIHLLVHSSGLVLGASRRDLSALLLWQWADSKYTVSCVYSSRYMVRMHILVPVHGAKVPYMCFCL